MERHIDIHEVDDLANAVYRVSKKRRYRKHARLVMFDGARGPAWLRRLVMTMAANLGMLGHDRSFDEDICVRSTRIDLLPFGKRLNEIVVNHMRNSSRRVTPDDLEIVCGQDQFAEILHELRNEMAFMAPIDVRDQHTRWNGIRVRIIPGLSGMAVLPLEKHK